MPFLAAIEIDQRQTVISASDKLKEMLGGSYHIAETVKSVYKKLAGATSTGVVMPVSGATWLTSNDFAELGKILWMCREEIVERLDLLSTFAIVEYSDLDEGKKDLEEKI